MVRRRQHRGGTVVAVLLGTVLLIIEAACSPAGVHSAGGRSAGGQPGNRACASGSPALRAGKCAGKKGDGKVSQPAATPPATTTSNPLLAAAILSSSEVPSTWSVIAPAAKTLPETAVSGGSQLAGVASCAGSKGVSFPGGVQSPAFGYTNPQGSSMPGFTGGAAATVTSPNGGGEASPMQVAVQTEAWLAGPPQAAVAFVNALGSTRGLSCLQASLNSAGQMGSTKLGQSWTRVSIPRMGDAFVELESVIGYLPGAPGSSAAGTPAAGTTRSASTTPGNPTSTTSGIPSTSTISGDPTTPTTPGTAGSSPVSGLVQFSLDRLAAVLAARGVVVLLTFVALGGRFPVQLSVNIIKALDAQISSVAPSGNP